MPDNRQVKRNVGVSNSSNPSVDNIQDFGIGEAIRWLRVQTSEKQDGGGTADSIPYPDRPGEPDCIYYMRTGMCGYGVNCRFNHPSNLGQIAIGQYGGELPERDGQPDCGYFLKTGTCKYGSSCKYHHPRDRHGAGPVVLNTLGLPMRQEEKSCPYYMRTGACKFGVGCKFHHPQPESAGSAFPVTGPAAYGSTSLSILPSSGVSYTGGLPAWSLTKSTYLSAPRSEGPQTYMPVIYPPPQGIVPSPGWSTYMGSLSPVASTNVFGESGFGGQVPPSSTAVSHLPERPDQPECRYFMNTGSCKYGSDCKYNHPREKIAQLAANSLGPLGLPLRPGQAVCSYYTLYGLCKYGPTCKYDHPLLGYSYNYSLNMPTLSILDSSVFPYQRNSPVIRSSETSPSKSPKCSDWTEKLVAASNKKQNAKTPEESPEQAGSPSHSLPASAEIPHDQSD